MAYKAALFDLDDTLLESVKAKMLQHQVIAKRHYDIDITHDTLRQCWGKPLTTMINEMYQSVDETERILDLLLHTDHEFPKAMLEGAADAITSLVDAGIYVGIITSAPTRAALRDLHRLGFPVEHMLCILGEDAVSAHKPDPAVFNTPKELLRKHNISNKEIVYVGDHFVDFQAASAANIDFIAVTSGIVEAHEFEALGAKCVTPGIVTAVNTILRQNAAVHE